jgi:hypothetical protein
MKVNQILITILIFFSWFNIAEAFDDEATHPEITKKAANVSVLKINNYLKGYLGENFSNGLDSIVKDKTVLAWLQKGSNAEDHPICRASHHFHNPRLLWLQSQMNDTPWMNYACDIPRYSNITWATGYTAPPPMGTKTNVVVSPLYRRVSWDTAREYFYKALTCTTAADRENYFAKTFEAVGHVLHLLEDMAVPAHTRNDFQSHLFPNSATFLGGFFDRYQPFEQYVKNNPNLVVAASSVFSAFTNTRLTDFWDADRYNGSNPSTLTNIGLAEFSNANYFSDFTIPNNGTTSEHFFPYPHLSSSNSSGPNYQICSYQFMNVASVQYVSRTNKGPCPPTAVAADHFAVVSLLNTTSSSDINAIAHVWLPDEVNKQYAEELLPRAIGYTAGLLNYFFRGQLGVSRISGGIKVTNLNTEEMSSYVDTNGNTIGKISVYYDDIADVRNHLESYTLTSPLAPGGEVTIPFASPSGNIQKGKYIVVFKGKLGNEEGAVIGKVSLSPLYYVKKVNGQDKIYMIDSTEGNDTVVYENEVFDTIGKISVSGSTLAFAGNSVIKLLDITTLPAENPTAIAPGNWPDWSPDGKKIVFERFIAEDPFWGREVELFTIDPATGVETQLTTPVGGANNNSQPAWSPNGNTIAYTKYAPGGTDCSTYYVVYLMDASGNPIGPLACPPPGETMTNAGSEPTWSPTGQEIAFVRQKRGARWSSGEYFPGTSFQLYKVNVSTKTVTKLTDSVDDGYFEYYPAWSSDGKNIAVTSERDGDWDIWLVDTQGSGYQMNLTDSNTDVDKYPAFGK